MRRNNRFTRSYEHRDRRLVIAIVTCQCSVCQLMFGVFLIVGGFMFRAFASEDEGPFAEFNKTPRLIGTILLCLGGILCFIGTTLVIVACVIYNRYEKDRDSRLEQSGGSDNVSGQFPLPDSLNRDPRQYSQHQQQQQHQSQQQQLQSNQEQHHPQQQQQPRPSCPQHDVQAYPGPPPPPHPQGYPTRHSSLQGIPKLPQHSLQQLQQYHPGGLAGSGHHSPRPSGERARASLAPGLDRY